MQLIEDLRGQVGKLVADLPAEALNWRPLEGEDEHATNSLAALAAHVAGAEHFWIGEVVGGRPSTRDRDAEFRTEAVGAAELVRRLEQVGAETREVFAGLTPADLHGTRQARDRTVPVRWGILHVIEHTALHLGHMQLTYQLWMGGQSVHSPLWFERLGNQGLGNQRTGNRGAGQPRYLISGTRYPKYRKEKLDETRFISIPRPGHGGRSPGPPGRARLGRQGAGRGTESDSDDELSSRSAGGARRHQPRD